VLMLVVHPSMPVKNVSDFIRLAKKRPRDINFGTGGKGSSTRLAMALLLNAASIKLVEVPYRGGGPANLALISGETQAMTSTIGSVATFLKNKQVRGLGVTSAKRVKPYPDIPAIGESVPGYEFSAWVGAFAPAGTPQPIIDKLNREMKKALSDPGVSAKLNALTLEPMHMAPAEFDRRLKEDYAKYDKLMKLATQASKR
jgi:tripartite-type tricarboxylate transporter receptor subunit TctC